MITVWKYQVGASDIFYVDMPKGAKVLDVQLQRTLTGRIPQIWALVDTEAPTTRRWFRHTGTNHSIKESLNLDYVGTYQVEDLRLVFHLFEILNV